MVCGIAAGIAAAYHAPVAGVVFVLELALGFFARHTVAPVLIASGTASALVYVMVDPKPLYATAPIAMVPSSIIFTDAGRHRVRRPGLGLPAPDRTQPQGVLPPAFARRCGWGSAG